MDAGLALGAWDETMPLKQGIKYELRDIMIKTILFHYVKRQQGVDQKKKIVIESFLLLTVLEYVYPTNCIGILDGNGLHSFHGPGQNEHAGPLIQKRSGISGW